MIREGLISKEEWEKSMFMSLISGRIKERRDIVVPKDCFPSSSHLLFNVVLEDIQTNQLFDCAAWSPPSGEAFVSVDKVYLNNEEEC